ncbi:MAG TPA: indolepyruvate ferredoxin oxidoreductase subunit alpha [Thermoplasmata archaeon]|nr:indolepyruvate ferredoxin oxidoreductase subunit alpha [Thermoplasmata archaeon]HIH97663.1 indolepyruvate ferredoxin oxidoreductase subunit alpha [Thermoplasmata archaeon]
MEKRIMSGNEAIAEGALEAGVEVVAGYPGTPSTEVLEVLAERSKSLSDGLHVEWSVNEKVALEIASGASWCGKRAMATMKMSGLNVASDSLASIAYSGCKGGLVVYVADDPSTSAGMVQQDSRFYALLSGIPCFDASSPRKAKFLAKASFEISEKTGAPILLRTTTRVAHSLTEVELGKRSHLSRPSEFEKNLQKYTKASSEWCTVQHEQTLERLKRAGELANELGFNKLSIKGKLGVIASGVSKLYVKELVKENSLELSVLEIETSNPLPREKIEKLLTHSNRVLVLEELEPIIETQVRSMALDCNKRTEILGKLDKDEPRLSRVGEYTYDVVAVGLEKLLGKQPISPFKSKVSGRAGELRVQRPLTFCAGCPHRGTYLAINEAIKKHGYKKGEIIVTGDIGCTILGMNKPFESCWTEVSMGASLGIAQGFRWGGIEKPILATIGDSTFFHAGIPPLINAKQHGVNLTLVILDNSWTAMTGYQPNPGTGLTATREKTNPVDLAALVRGCGIESVRVVNAFRKKEMIDAIYQAMGSKGISVVIARGECAIQSARRKKKFPKVQVNEDKCTGCKRCMTLLACPAIAFEGEKARIDPSLCDGCGVCVCVCPANAIEEVK